MLLPCRQVLIPHPSMLYGALLLLLTSYAAGQSLEFSPKLSIYRVAPGERARVHCVLKGGGDSEQRVTWLGPALASNRATTENSRSSSTLTIDRVETKDAGDYSCSYRGLPTISIRLNVVVEPGFLNVQEYQVFTEGTDAVVQCPAFFGNNSQASMSWFQNDVTINCNSAFYPENGRLTIRNIRKEANGTQYQCTIMDRNGRVLGPKTITVEVLPQSEFAPRIDDSKRNIEVVLGQPLNLSCRLKQQREDAAVTYSWTIDTEFEHDVLINTSANLQIEAYRFLGGIYTCRVENEFGYDIADFSVKILAAPLPSNCLTTTRIGALGQGTTAVLKYCELTSPVELSDLKFLWKGVKTHNESEELIDINGRISINHNGWLIIENVGLSDLGVYKVNISNKMGYAVDTVKLESVNVTSSPATSPQAQTQNLSQLDGVPINIKFEVQGGSLKCHDVKERIQDLIQQHLFDEFGFADVTFNFEAALVHCASDSKVGTFKATIMGRNAHMLVAQVNLRGLSDLTLSNGRTLRLRMCTNDCSLQDIGHQDSTAPFSIPGGIIAATFIFVVLAGALLLIVILIRYRRRSLVKCTDEEQVLPLHLAGTVQAGHLTNQELKSVAKNKPVYGRSISLTFPVTSS